MRFSTVTPSALKTSTPLRPEAVRPEVLVAGGRRALRRARLGPVDDDAVSVQPAQVDVRRRDQHAGAGLIGRLVSRVVAALVVIARRNQDPVAGSSGVDGGLDRVELRGSRTRRMALGHAQDAGRRGSGEGKRTGEGECEHQQPNRPRELPCARDQACVLHSAALWLRHTTPESRAQYLAQRPSVTSAGSKSLSWHRSGRVGTGDPALGSRA